MPAGTPLTRGRSLSGPVADAQDYKREFWSRESEKFSTPHYRLEKGAHIINKLAGPGACTLLDVGCGPGTLRHLLRPNIEYFGIDIAIPDPAPNLLEVDLLESPVRFGDKRFDIITAQGLFEYLGGHQATKFAEIANLLHPEGTFVVTYTNFAHRKPKVYEAYSNVRPMADFHACLSSDFVVRRSFAASYNWAHGQPVRKLVRAVNMPVHCNVPFVGKKLAVEYFFICSLRPAGR